MIIDAQYLHPNKREKKIVKPLLRLVSKVSKCLGDKFHDVFGATIILRYAYRVAAGIDIEEDEEKQVFRRIDGYLQND